MGRSTHRRRGPDRRSHRRGAGRRFAPLAMALEERTLLSISIVDVSVLEGNSGPVQVAGAFETSSETDYYQFQGTAGRVLVHREPEFSPAGASE